jgi:hypothetical protein
MAEVQTTSIPVSTETRDQIRTLKRGGETWDDLVVRIAEQYDPEQVRGSDQ